MDAGFEHTMLGACGVGKFVVIAGKDRWTTCCFASRDAVVAWISSGCVGLAIEGRPTAMTGAAHLRVPLR